VDELKNTKGLSKLEECAGRFDVEVYKGGGCNRRALLGQEWPSLGGLEVFDYSLYSKTNFTPSGANVSSWLGDSDNPLDTLRVLHVYTGNIIFMS